MAATERAKPDPRRYFEAVGDERGPIAEQEPVCLYLETTNRCNLLCETCPRTFEDLEPPADMSWDLFTHIVDQFPDIARAVLHGVGEPMMVKHLPRMVRYLKDRGTYVLFNTNGTLLNDKNGRALIAAGLDATLQTDRADVNVTQSTREINNLPLFGSVGRNYQSILQLIPGTSRSQGFVSNGSGEENSAAGNPQRSISYNVNGVSRLQNNTRIDGT